MTCRPAEIAALAEAGATIVGTAPEDSPSLTDRAEFGALKTRLWSGQGVTSVGKGRMIATSDVEQGLDTAGLKPDFDFSGESEPADAVRAPQAGRRRRLFRQQPRRDGSAYRRRFRVTGKRPEIWRADTGQTEAVSYHIDKGVTIVPLDLAAEDSFFVVFRKPALSKARTLPSRTPVQVAPIDGVWDVAFQPNRGGACFDKAGQSRIADRPGEPERQIFFRSPTYAKAFMLPKGVRPGSALWLDLGRVGDLAQVRVNGRLVGTAWHAPFRLDIGKFVKSGLNRLEIRVADLWVNRLIGDAQPGANKITWTPLPTYKPTRRCGRPG